MTTPSIYAYRAAQAAADVIRRMHGVSLCSCGAEYRDTPDGKRVHQTLHGHTPTPAPEGGAR